MRQNCQCNERWRFCDKEFRRSQKRECIVSEIVEFAKVLSDIYVEAITVFSRDRLKENPLKTSDSRIRVVLLSLAHIVTICRVVASITMSLCEHPITAYLCHNPHIFVVIIVVIIVIMYSSETTYETCSRCSTITVQAILRYDFLVIICINFNKLIIDKTLISRCDSRSDVRNGRKVEIVRWETLRKWNQSLRIIEERILMKRIFSQYR